MSAPKATTLAERVREAYQQGKLDALKAAELKEFLKEKEIPAAGVKQFLITLVKEYFEN